MGETSTHKDLLLDLMLTKLRDTDPNLRIIWGTAHDNHVTVYFRAYGENYRVNDKDFQRFLLTEMVCIIHHFLTMSPRRSFVVNSFSGDALRELHQDLCDYHDILRIKLFEYAVRGGFYEKEKRGVDYCELAHKAVKAYIDNDVRAYADVAVKYFHTFADPYACLMGDCRRCVQKLWQYER